MNGKSQATKSIREASTKLALSTSLLLSLTVLTIPANAQGYGSPNQFANVGSEQDSYLPPEVVPSTQANMPAQAQASSNAPAAGNNAPGFNPAAQANMMSKNNAAAMKQSFYNSMMGQGNYPQMQGAGAPMGGQAFAQNGPQSQAGAPNGQLGQSPWVTAQNSGANGTPAQSQTLSGGVQNQTPNSANRKGVGFSHGLSTVTSLGASALFTGLMMSRNPLGGVYMGSMMGGSLLNQGFNGGGIRY